jgi:serine/threonine protein kinase
MINSSFTVKIADFGLAKKITQSISVMNSFVGTLAYSSPELVQNQKYNEKADIWSLGCILYELIMKKAPFQSNNPLSLAKKVIADEKNFFFSFFTEI